MISISISNSSDLPLPYYQTLGSAGLDLYANIPEGSIMLSTMQRQLIATGISIALPAGYEAQIRPRSGLAFKQGITCLNSPGTIDSDYRGEIKILLINLSDSIQKIEHGMRIAQLVVAQYAKISWNLVADLEETERNKGGFGSTGLV